MKSLLLPCVPLLLLAILTNEARAITPPATIAYVEGIVLIKRKGAAKLEPAEIGMSVFRGDQIQTRAGKCQINMTGSGILRLSPNTAVLFPEGDNEGDKISVLRMLKGKTARNIENLWNDEVFEVRTPSLVAGTQDGYNPDQARIGHRSNEAIDQQIERLRAEGNAKLDAIRAELKNLDGKPIHYPCGNCGNSGPHRWTADGWECNCGATAASFGNYPTSKGAYNAVRDDYKARIEQLESQKSNR